MARLFLSLFVLIFAGLAPTAVRAEDRAFEPLPFASLGDYAIDISVLDTALSTPEAPLPSLDNQIPARIWSWQGRRVEVEGFMLPVRFEGDKVTEFMFFSSPSACCYGVVPKVNEWINVKVPAGTPAKMDIPLLLKGVLSVGTRHEGGYVTGIYHLALESIEVAPAPAAAAPTDGSR